MPKLIRHAATAAVLISASLVSLTSAAHADDPAPTAPPNAPEMPMVSPEGDASAGLSSAPSSGPSSAVEPTFTTETTHRSWPNVPLLATGATVFGISYLPAVAGAAFSDAGGHKDLYIPVAGPWMMFARGAEETKGEKALLVIDGVAQGLGALMLLSSLFIPEKSTEHWYLIGKNDVLLAPTRLATGYGMGARGRF